jgi:PAS domain S-box-containing protein
MLFASSAGVRPPSRWLFAPVILGIAAFVTLLAAVGFLGIRYWHEQQSASHQVEHSRQVIEALERVQTSLNDLETERRGYLLTPQPTFVKPYGVSEDTVRAGVEALQALVADDPLQSLRASHLALIVDAKLRQMDEIIETARTSGLEAALAKLQGKDEIQSQIDQMLDIERFLIANWQPRVDALQQSTVWLIAAAVLLAFIFAGAAFGLAWLEETRRRKATEENTRLYRDLEEREAKIQRLIDSNIIGILFTTLEPSRIIDANDAFLDMVGFTREDLVAGRMSWAELTPAEWRAASLRAIAELGATGRCKPFEKEYFRKDGSRVPVLVGAAAFERSRNASVAFVLDLTERKQAEGRQRRAEEELHKAQADLAHVTRVTTLGELTASIAHEVNQPLGALVTNAEACLLWLNHGTPNLVEARRNLKLIINDGHRAGEVIRHIRALSQKTDPQKAPLHINDVVNEVVALVQREVFSHRVTLRKKLAPALPVVLADRVQL